MNTNQTPPLSPLGSPSCYALPPVLERPARILPPNILEKMAPADRAAIGQKSGAELRAVAVTKDEREIQKLIAGYLRLLDVWAAQSRMDRRTSNTVGTPDFLFCYRGRFVAWEVKCSWARNLRPEQAQARDAIIAQGGEWRLITSLAEAQAHLREMDGISRGRGDTEDDHGR